MTTTFRDIIELWPSPDAMAADIGARVEAVRKWKQRDSIPADWWTAVVSAGHGVTVDDLARIAATRRSQPAEAVQ